jgi:hypothetical protein
MSILPVNNHTLRLPRGTSAEKIIHTFVCKGTSQQLVITKKETADKVYSVAIKYRGVLEERSRWEVCIYKHRRTFTRLRYVGSRAFSFKLVEGILQIKESDENADAVRYVDLNSNGASLPILPSSAIKMLLHEARAFSTKSAKTILFNDSIVVMEVGSYGEDCKPKIYVGCANSPKLKKCSYVESSLESYCKVGLDVEYEGKVYLFETFPLYAAPLDDEDYKWAGNRLYNGN